MKFVEIQLEDANRTFVAGDTVKGDVLITWADPIELVNLKIAAKGTLRYYEDKYVEGRYVERETNCEGKTTEKRSYSRQKRRYPRESLIVQTDPCLLVERRRKLSPGITKFPFEIKLPLKHRDGEPLLPTLTCESAEFSMSYQLVATASTPWTLIPWFDSRSYAHIPITIVNEIRSGSSPPDDELQSAETEVKVGFWMQDSLKLGRMIAYAFGEDTATVWRKFTVKASMASSIALTEDEPYYLQDSLRLTVSPIDDDTKVCEHKYRVEGVSVVLETTVSAYSSPRTVRYQPVKMSDQWKEEIEAETDITSFISGAKIPASTPPSIDQRNVNVHSSLLIVVKLRAITEDGTRQASATAKLVLPLRITSVGYRTPVHRTQTHF